MIDWTWTEVDQLEKLEKWNEAKRYLLNSWRQHPEDLKTVIRLGFFCWYVTFEHGPLGITENDIDIKELELFWRVQRVGRKRRIHVTTCS